MHSPIKSASTSTKTIAGVPSSQCCAAFGPVTWRCGALLTSRHLGACAFSVLGDLRERVCEALHGETWLDFMYPPRIDAQTSSLMLGDSLSELLGLARAWWLCKVFSLWPRLQC